MTTKSCAPNGAGGSARIMALFCVFNLTPLTCLTSASIYVISPSGGILQGDRYRIGIKLSNNAHAHITTQGTTRKYEMEKDYATQMIDILVEEGCYCEYIPDQVIPYANSRVLSTN